MSAANVIAYGIVFVAGPVLYLLLTRLTPSNAVLGVLAMAVVAWIVLALVLRASLPLAALACFWLAWVLAVSQLILALKRRSFSRRQARFSFVAGLLATTLPWFGLATAQMVAY